uniref:Uncharacterized protein n=1 Tax=Onchocerca volvulus TaxID=6282 RepID=A0A8R1TSJ1_ONCVO
MEPHPSIPASTTFTTSTSSTVDFRFDSTTTIYYTVAPISYAVDVSSSIPYRDVIVSNNNVFSEKLSSETCSKACHSSDNIEELSDDNPSNKCNESTPLNADGDSQVKDEIQQLPLSSNLETIVSVQRLPLSFRLKPNIMAQRLPLSCILEPNIMTQQLPSASNLQINTAIQPLPLHSIKSSQATDDFQHNLPILRKIQLLNDKATHYARLAQDAWEEARTIAASLHMSPTTLPNTVDFMLHSYIMNQREWDLPKIADVQERIEPDLSQVINQESIVSSPSSSIFQSIPERIKLSPKLILSTNSKSDPDFNQVSWMTKNTCRYNNAKFTNIAAGMVENFCLTLLLQLDVSEIV